MTHTHNWEYPFISTELIDKEAIILSIGTNMGDKEANLTAALNSIAQLGEVAAISSAFHTEPWGFDSNNQFLNAVIIIKSELSKEALLLATQEIEKSLGRKYKSQNGIYSDRVIDIDIIDYKSVIYNSERLTLPHKLMHERLFVLDPLCEIYPTYRHPVVGKTAEELRVILTGD